MSLATMTCGDKMCILGVPYFDAVLYVCNVLLENSMNTEELREINIQFGMT